MADVKTQSIPKASPKGFKTTPKPIAKDVSFKAGDHAVYPGHGVGKVLAVEIKEIMGTQLEFYSVQILETGLKIMVPKTSVVQVGLRPIISPEDAAKVIEILKIKEVKIDTQTWNRRFREYTEKINTGLTLS